ncbi:MAG: GerMN domain-containing protein [Acidimicrobiales bacterium]
MTRRRPLGATVAALVGAVVVVGGCGIPADEEPRAIPRDNVPSGVLGDDTGSTVPGGDTVTAGIYLVQTSEEGRQLVEVARQAAAATPAGVLEALFDATVSDEEAETGITTLVPSATGLASQPELVDGTLTIDLTEGFSTVQGEGLSAAFGQIVCTADALGDVERVRFEVAGRSTEAIDGDGAAADPVSCRNYSSLLAPVDP